MEINHDKQGGMLPMTACKVSRHYTGLVNRGELTAQSRLHVYLGNGG